MAMFLTQTHRNSLPAGNTHISPASRPRNYNSHGAGRDMHAIGVFDMDWLHAALQAADLKLWILVRLFIRLETVPRIGHFDVAIKVPWDRFKNCRLCSRAHFLKSNCTGSSDDTAISWLARLTRDNFDTCFVIILTPFATAQIRTKQLNWI